MTAFLEAIVGDNIFEVRALECRGDEGRRSFTASGFFDDIDEAVEAIHDCEAEATPQGIYVTINPVDPDLLARRNNTIGRVTRSGFTATDGDIVKRRWLLIDIDAKRKSGISATNAEKHAAVEAGAQIAEWLTQDFGWPEPACEVMSGNGAHLYYRLCLPNDAASTTLINRLLAAVATKFDSAQVSVDRTVGNASRIARVAGTYARKGSNVKTRPWRRARVQSISETPSSVTQAMLESVAVSAPPQQPAIAGPAGAFPKLKVAQWLDDAGVTFTTKSRPDGITLFVLDKCPFNPEHNRGEAFISQDVRGVMGAGCHHNSCAGKGWSEFRDKIGRPRREHWDNPQGIAALRRGEVEPGELNVTRLSTVERQAVRWLWPMYVPRGAITLIDADPQAGKSHLAAELIARVSKGRAMPPDRSHERVREQEDCVLLSAEDSAANTIVPRLEAAEANCARVHFCSALTTSSGQERGIVLPNDLLRIEELVRDRNAAMLVIDPITAFLAADINANMDTDVRRALAPLAAMAEQTGVAVVLIRHLNKKSGLSPAYRGGGAIAFYAQARSALLLGVNPNDKNRRVLVQYKNNLAKQQPSLEYRIVESDMGGSRIEWLGTCDLCASDIVDRGVKRESKVALCRHAIVDKLADGPMKSRDLQEAVFKATGAKGRTYDAARAACNLLNAQDPRDGNHAHWTKLPGQRFPWQTPENGPGLAKKAGSRRRRHRKTPPLRKKPGR